MKISPARSTVDLSRREFLAATGLLTLAACSTTKPAPVAPRVGTQLYGWGQYYDRDRRKLYDNLPEALSAIRDCGYDYAEGSLDSNRPENNARFAELLRAKGLQPVSLYTGGALHQKEKAEQTVAKLLDAAKTARAAGFFILNCNPDPIGREKTDDELKTQAGALTSLGRGLKDSGWRLGIHHHTPEFRNGGREFHHNFHQCPAGLVDFCYDVHWVYRGGILPMDALDAYGAQVVSWHLRQSRDKIWWEDLAAGDIDYVAVASVARKRGLPPYYTVELALETGTKITRGVVENHRRSRDYIRDVFQA